MTLFIYNTRTREKEAFVPQKEGVVSMYVCGPTVYDRAHLGNARPVVVFDVLYRLLSRFYAVTYVRNITDIDDKIMKAAADKKCSIETITTETTAFFHQDMGALGALSPTHEPRATEYVGQMIAMTERLIESGKAYEKEGHVLFDVEAHEPYGCLSGCHQDDILAGARVEVAPYKKNPQDFVLWKPSTPEMPGWESPWGRGRPGWHIECSAMSEALLGGTFDIHGGGQDLIFPHHENELAQSTALHGENSFARFWVHNGILTVNGEKMSKSLGNFMTVEDLLNQASGELIRFAILSTHYRQSLDWTEETIQRSKASLDRLYRALEGFNGQGVMDEGVLEALLDDLNTPQAFAILFGLAGAIQKEKKSLKKEKLQARLKGSAEVLGLLQQNPSVWFQWSPEGSAVLKEDEVIALIEERDQAKKSKDYQKADEIRTALLEQGVILEDFPQGTTWRRKG